MWSRLATFILRNRISVLLGILLVTCFMGWMARDVKMSYKFAGLLPQTDSTYIKYQRFIEEYSEDGNVLVIGVNDPKIKNLEVFNAWYDLSDELKQITVPVYSNELKTFVEQSAVDSVFSVSHTYDLTKNEDEKRFDFNRVLTEKIGTQAELDSFFRRIHNLPFYDNILYKSDSDFTLMMVFVNADLFNSEDRGPSIDNIMAKVNEFTEKHDMEIYVSGLPFIRTQMTSKVKKELKFFIILAAIITGLFLFFFFNNWRVVLISMIVVSIGVIISLGTIAIFDYPITMLMGLIPPLIIVIGVPNCIYLINKYHSEFKRHGKKALALTRVVEKIGVATFLTNMTTSLGFATFIFTHSDMLREFGVIASINVIVVFIVSILLIPIFLSYIGDPKVKHLSHLDRKWVYKNVNRLVHIIQNNRVAVYVLTSFILVGSLVGISLMKTTGNIVSDLPSHDRVLTDLKWFENEVGGVMPFEILIDSKKANKITKPSSLKKIQKLQNVLSEYSHFSKSLSIADATKYMRQSFYNGEKTRYDLFNNRDRNMVADYINLDQDSEGVSNIFLDSLKSKTRISARIADIGTEEMALFMEDFQPRLDSIFPPEKYDVTITGTSVVFLKGSEYMVRNLFRSLLLAIIVIAFILAFLFKSVRMVIISLLPNILPLLFTAGMMGYLGISLKPSTILVFSIAFGISVDDTIHFLAKYRQELKRNHWNIKTSVLLAVRETGVSMMYTSVVLFFGFGIFVASEFDGTRALGLLVSMTLLIAMFANLVVLPSLLLSLDKRVTTKAFKEPYLILIDEEEDIELDSLQVKIDPDLTNNKEES